MKLLTMVAVIVAMASSVAAVSAFEAHTINVTAHIENALFVDTDDVAFGTIFPEEWFKIKRVIGVSSSALGEFGSATGELTSVEYSIFAECKPLASGSGLVNSMDADGTIRNNDGGAYYAWPDWVWVGLTPSQFPALMTGMFQVGAVVANCDTDVKLLTSGSFNLAAQTDELEIAMDTPVWRDSYNILTDVPNCVAPGGVNPNTGQITSGTLVLGTDTKPNGLCVPTHIIEDTGDEFDVLVGLEHQIDVGIDIKVQVTGITRVN